MAGQLRLTLLFFLPLAVSPHSGASPQALADTLRADADSQRTYYLDEVIVTGVSPVAPLREVSSPISVIHQRTFEATPGSLVADAVVGVPGVLIKQYGGGSAVQNATIRGMSAEHTLVLIDGQRLNSLENGTTDLGYLSTLAFDRIEIARGGWSAMYGSDAVGGVINLISEKPDPEVHARARQSLGTNGYGAEELSASGRIDGLAIAGGFRQERGRGDYEFDFSDGRTTTRLRRSDDDFKILSGNLRFAADLASTLHDRAIILYADADRGSPGPVSDASSSGRARLQDQLVIAQNSLVWNVAEEWRGSLAGSFHYSLEHYSDPLLFLGGFPLQSFYDNRTIELQPELQYLGSSTVTGDAGMDLGYGKLSSSDVRTARRWEQSYYVNSQIKIPAGIPLVDEILLYPSIRYDRFSDVDGDVSPRLGINIGFLGEPEVRLRASYGKSFRAPTFNELYWIAGGNPMLTPERSLSFDAGVQVDLALLGVLTFQGTYFSIDTKDRIVWEPQSGGFWSPRNINRVTSQGVESELRWRGLKGRIELGAAGTWTNARKKSAEFPGDPAYDKYLIDIPLEVVDMHASLNLDMLTLVVHHCWTGFRYTTETNDHFLPHYSLTSIAARYTYALRGATLSLKLEVTNLFNMSYQVVALYPMPLREFRGTIGVEL